MEPYHEDHPQKPTVDYNHCFHSLHNVRKEGNQL